MSINFYVVDSGEEKPVSYDENITVENFIKDFLNKNNIYVTLDPNIYTFKIYGKVLNLEKFRQHQLKSLIPPGGKVILYRKQDVHYSGGPMAFTDVSKNNVTSRGFSSDAPDYRVVKKGINIYGICKTKNCVAQDKKVISLYRKDKINMIEEKFNFKCPKCEGIIEPKTVGFYLCKYRIYGSKIEDKKIVDFDNGISDANDPNHSSYFDEVENGNVIFTELIFEVISYH